jgi:sporulation protein YhbH
MTVAISSFAVPWDLRRRGLKDSIRHDKRVREAIKQNLKELIAEETIITSDGQKVVKIPVRYLDQYRFIFDRATNGRGVGQGPGNVGDVIASDENGSAPGQAGDQPGQPIYEAEISIEELTRMMLEDLALPWLEQKQKDRIKTEAWRFEDIRKKGSLANLDRRRTLKQSLKRHAAMGKPKVGKIVDDDLRFRIPEIRDEFHSNCAVYLLMDRSGSMTTEKKYITKSFFFWMVRFLQLKYRTVETIFIAHDTEAAVVPEKDFFTLSNSGGTMCSSAYALALDHIAKHHPPARWNNYVFHFSDGDNYADDNARCLTLVKDLLRVATMVGYGEVNYNEFFSAYTGRGVLHAPPWSTLLREFKALDHPRFLAVTLEKREQVYEALREFLKVRES